MYLRPPRRSEVAVLETITVLILASCAHLSPGFERRAERSVVHAIAAVAADPELRVTPHELAVLVTYAALESGMSSRPMAFSWDARAHVSCGYLQEPCGFVDHASLEEQARYWIREERAVGLASVDSDPRRAGRRERRADRVLESIAGCPWHAALLASFVAFAAPIDPALASQAP